MGPRAYCLSCFHGWRTQENDFAYQDVAMCPVGTSQARLQRQIDFFAPFTPGGAAILEIGCATGELALAVRVRLAPRLYEAIELSPAAAQAAGRVDRLH